MLNSLEIERYLIQLKFRQYIDNERINGFVRDDIKYPLFVKTPNRNSKLKHVTENPLVIHSVYKNQKHLLSEIKEIYPDWENYYHNTNLKGFDKRINKGKLEIFYGIAVNIENENGLEKLVDWLSRSLLSAKPSASEHEDIENAKDELSKIPETTRETNSSP